MPSPVAARMLKFSAKPDAVRKSAPPSKDSDFDAELEKATPQPVAKPDTPRKPEVRKKVKAAPREPGPGVPVMGEALDPTDGVAVGPGRPDEAVPAQESPALEEAAVDSDTRKRRQ